MTLRAEDSATPPPPTGEVHPDHAPGEDASPGAERSLLEDVEDLVEDARIYLDAELSYQKSRASFVSERLQKLIIFGLAGAFLAFLATIALTVGLVIALTPLVTGWGATAIVVLVYLLLAYLLVRKAGSAWGAIMDAVRGDDEQDDETDNG